MKASPAPIGYRTPSGTAMRALISERIAGAQKVNDDPHP